MCIFKYTKKKAVVVSFRNVRLDSCDGDAHDWCSPSDQWPAVCWCQTFSWLGWNSSWVGLKNQAWSRWDHLMKRLNPQQIDPCRVNCVSVVNRKQTCCTSRLMLNRSGPLNERVNRSCSPLKVFLHFNKLTYHWASVAFLKTTVWMSVTKNSQTI